MQAKALFLNDAGRLRSGWRLGLFVCAFVALIILLYSVANIVFVIEELLQIGPGPYTQNIVFKAADLGAAVLAGWICNYWLEGLPWRALGLCFHSGWWRDLLVGSLVGALSLAIAALIAFATGRLRFTFSEKEMLSAVARALVGTAVLFIVAALAEEAAFRGYPLQTTIRAHMIAFGILITSVLPFAAAHLRNPSFTALSFTNTALAGVLFAIAYLRTRSLWFPMGIHWAWNFAQGSIFGGPVSGLIVTNHPLLHSFDKGPVWMTGGSYGLEGGVCCTIALLLSTLFIWRTRLVSATPELKKLTSEENPVRENVRQT
jgi:uncharacterized protein